MLEPLQNAHALSLTCSTVNVQLAELLRVRLDHRRSQVPAEEISTS